MNEKIKNLLAGIISIVILATITMLYFSNIIFASDSRAVAYFTQQPLINNTCGLELPTKPTIILRMDDIQMFFENISLNLTRTIFDNNFSVTWGLIPSRMNENIERFVFANFNNPLFEVSQHGTYHAPDEFKNLTEEEAFNLMKRGNDIIVKNLEIIPVTFIPPYDEFNDATIKAMENLGFSIISGKLAEMKSYGQVFNLGYNIDVKNTKTKELLPVENVVKACSTALNLTNICVIKLHVQDYTNDLGEIDSKKYEIFVKMLQSLKDLQAETSTYKGLLRC